MRWQAGNGQETDKVVRSFAALPWEDVFTRSELGTRKRSRMISAFRIRTLSSITARMSVRYISRDVRQFTKNPIFSVFQTVLSFQELSKIIKSDKRPGTDYLVVDVRDSDFIGGNIINCRHVPSNTFSDKLDALVRETKNVPQVIFHCALSQARWVTNTRISLTP